MMGTALAASHGYLRPLIALLSWLTATLLQVLSNLANDYGDFRHGLDNAERLGPKRAVQSGAVSSRQMLAATAITAALALVSGLALVLLAFWGRPDLILLFILLGAAALWAAIAYTATDKPYGYVGLGDLMVLIFFGWVAVAGSYFLQTLRLPVDILLPATSSGLLAVAVLNVNNIRDITSDQKSGKISLPVRLGAKRARLYHAALLITAVLCATLYVYGRGASRASWLFLLSTPLLVIHMRRLWQRYEPHAIDPLLKQMALTTLAFTLLFGLGVLL
jgi:1,4-dihydroxy-2-naphthoate octaprenyltransferase